jgi:hypothetical protein
MAADPSHTLQPDSGSVDTNRSSGTTEQENGDGSTCLKWGSNGELSPVDLQRVLERLCDAELTHCPLEEPG